MLFTCPKVEESWTTISFCLSNLGYNNYDISIEHIIRGDLENPYLFSFNLLISKKVIYNAMKNDKSLYKQQVINVMKHVHYSERYKASLKD